VTEDVRLLTYDEIASTFGITRESARQLVIRKRWGRRKGNDGKARIEVPEDAMKTSDATPPGWLEVEQRRSAELREERDRWQEKATAPPGEGLWCLAQASRLVQPLFTQPSSCVVP
jgi:hypothetical protein